MLNDYLNTNDNGYSFRIDLNCAITSIAPPTSPSDYTFDIGTSDYNWNIGAWT